MIEPIDKLTARVLREHLLQPGGKCLCGWGNEPAQLSSWHSDHVVEHLRASGVLRRTCD